MLILQKYTRKTSYDMTILTPLDFLIIFPIFFGVFNLAVPFIIKESIKIRNILLIGISICFFLNVILIDYLYLNSIEMKFTLLSINKYSVVFSMEPIGLIFLTMLALLWIPALSYTINFITVNNFSYSSKYLFFVNSCILVGCLVSLSANLITMFITYEILTFCTIPLISYYPNKESLDGLYKYLTILLLSGIILFLPAIIIIYSATGAGTFTAGGFIKDYFSNRTAIILLITFIFGISKTAIFPLHGWLPSAMVASYPVSALLHSVVVVKTGLFCIYKIIFYVFGLEYLQLLFSQFNWLVLIPTITIVYSSLLAMRVNKIKMLLAYSTISQLSISLISAFLLTPKGLSAAIVHMVSHSFTKISIFYAAGSFYSLNKTYYISDLNGIGTTMPKTSLILLIATLSLIGIPPFAGFISKFDIIVAAAESENLFVVIVVASSSIFSFLYISRIIISIYKPIGIKKHIEEKVLPSSMFVILYLCISLVFIFFFIKQLISITLTFI